MRDCGTNVQRGNPPWAFGPSFSIVCLPPAGIGFGCASRLPFAQGGHESVPSLDGGFRKGRTQKILRLHFVSLRMTHHLRFLGGTERYRAGLRRNEYRQHSARIVSRHCRPTNLLSDMPTGRMWASAPTGGVSGRAAQVVGIYRAPGARYGYGTIPSGINA